MTNLRTCVAISATAAAIAFGQSAFAQDDLDEALALALEGDAPAAETKVEAPAEEAAPDIEDEEADEAPAAVLPAPAPVALAAPAAPKEEAAPAEASAEPVVEVKKSDVDEALVLVNDLAAELSDEDEPAAVEEIEEPAVEEAAEAPAAEAAEAPAEESAEASAPAAAAAPVVSGPDAELIEQIRATEKIRREAMDLQAQREIDEARAAMLAGEYTEAVRHYGNASRFLNDSPEGRKYKAECNTGIAEGLYLAALEEDRTGRRERAIKLIEKAVDMRHPKARRQLEAWRNADDPDKNKTDISEIRHRRNEDEYKTIRERELQHLRRARQFLAQGEIQRALDECELVLVGNPYSTEALSLRKSIERRRASITKKEHDAAREGMIADVDRAWRPVYAVDARELDESVGNTIRRNGPDGGEVTVEQSIIKRMKEMRLPAISFKPPATIIDAVEYFRSASKDFDRPDIPIEKRGFNFVLKTPEAVRMQQGAGDDSDDFSDSADADEGSGPLGVPVIPMITASDISFYDALKLVCESVEYKFTVQGPIVMVMQKDMSTQELVTRSFPVLSTFLEKMSSASDDITTMQSSGFGGNRNRNNNNNQEDEGQERDWKEFFSLLGVQWPEGSSIFYVKTVGRLFVKNTQDNLAEFENVLLSLNQQVTLVEIETRFVEVTQEDLNSLGFEWILNGDYTLGLNKHIGKALGIRSGEFSGSTLRTASTTTAGVSGSSGGGTGDTGIDATGGVAPASSSTGVATPTYTYSRQSTVGAAWSKPEYTAFNGNNRNVGISSIDGIEYSTGNRYLSTLGNPVSGENVQTNDKFMKVNAFLGSADLSMILHMLSQRSDTDLLSAPKVLTRPGEEAVIKVVTEYIYPTDYDVQLQSSNSGGGYGGYGGGSSSILAVVEPQGFTMREVGVILQVTPTLTDDGNVVDLELNTQIVDEPTWKNYGMKIPFTGNSSALQNFAGIGDILGGLADVLGTLGMGLSAEQQSSFAEAAVGSATTALDNLTASTSTDNNMTYYEAPMEQPFFHVRSVDSKVSVYPGATIVMGGLITEVRRALDDKVPFLGDIPFLGRFFRSHAERTTKRNLLIFVTTRIVDGRGREMHNDGFELSDAPDVKSAPDELDD